MSIRIVVGTPLSLNALANSINTISARLMDQVGPKPVVALMKKMGINSFSAHEVINKLDKNAAAFILQGAIDYLSN